MHAWFKFVKFIFQNLPPFWPEISYCKYCYTYFQKEYWSSRKTRRFIVSNASFVLNQGAGRTISTIHDKKESFQVIKQP